MVFNTKQEVILSRMNPQLAELIRESMSSKDRMHKADFDMIPLTDIAASDQSSEPVQLKEYESDKKEDKDGKK